MSFDLEKIKKTEMTEEVILRVTYIPKMDDGYGSWNKGDKEVIVGKTLDDPGLNGKIEKEIQAVLQEKDVKEELQRPLFALEERKTRTMSLKVGVGVTLGGEE